MEEEEITKKQLPKNLIEPWLVALRSGKYTQGRGTLEHYNAYCCLGVYNVIHGIANHGPDGYVNVQAAIGGKLIDRCIVMNDKLYLSFPKIADYIEQNYELV